MQINRKGKKINEKEVRVGDKQGSKSSATDGVRPEKSPALVSEIRELLGEWGWPSSI